MKVKTTDQLHISSLGSDTIPAGTTIDVTDSMAADLVKRGLATGVGASKAAAKPRNKARQTPRNKAGR